MTDQASPVTNQSAAHTDSLTTIFGPAKPPSPREPSTILPALAAVMAEVQSIEKGERNQEQGYMFRGINAVVNHVGPALRNAGIVVVPMLLTAAYRDVRTSRDKPSREATVQVRYRFYGPSGYLDDFIDAVVPGESMDVGDKGTPKAMSVAFRIALEQALCIPTTSPEPDSQSYERADDDFTQEGEVGAGSPAAIELFAKIMAAGTDATLRAAWEDVNLARQEGRINTREAAQLNAHVKVKLAELGGGEPGDGTANPE